MVNLEWYRTFTAIFEENTLTKAAQSLYKSQPGVSVHLNSLESYVGKKLFKRTSRKMIPTEEGKQLYNFIIDAIEKLEKAEQHFNKTSKEVIPSIHIGMCTEIFQTILEPEVSSLPFNLVATFGDHRELINDLNNSILDLVITPNIKNDDSPIEYEAFAKEKIVMVAGSKTDLNSIFPLIEKKDISGLEKELKKRVWYSASNEMDHFRRFWYQNLKERVDFKPNYILPNIRSIIRCIENNNGLAILPDFLVGESLQNKKTTLVWQGQQEVSHTLYFATRPDLQFKKEVARIKEIFKRKINVHSNLKV